MLRGIALNKNGQPILIIGLSHDNLERLKAGQPITFNLAELNACPVEVVILAGETERAIANDLGTVIGGHNGTTH